MKRFVILIFILVITIATLCGCSRDNKSNNVTSESITQEHYNEQKNDTLANGTNSVSDKNDETDANINDVNSDAYSDNPALSKQQHTNEKSNDKSNNVNPSENSASSPSSDKEYEAEIDFSELE